MKCIPLLPSAPCLKAITSVPHHYEKCCNTTFEIIMSVTVNLIYKATLGRMTGLERDAFILQQALEQFGFEINHYRITERRLFKKCKIPQSLTSKIKTYLKTRLKKFNFNIFLEKIHPDLFDLANINLFIPNHERFGKWSLPLLEQIDYVLCKTKYAEEIFQKLAPRVDYIGFTSTDRLLQKISKDYGNFLHVGGKSFYRRGTYQILDLWKENPKFSQLIVVAHGIDTQDYRNHPNIKIFDDYISDPFLEKLQNQAGVHLCLSEAEGFGHFIMEGLSCGSCVITTNGKPMNELVESDRGYLVNCSSIQEEDQYFHEKFCFDPVDFKRKVLQVMEEPVSEKIRKYEMARHHFKQSDHFFRESLQRVMKKLVALNGF